MFFIHKFSLSCTIFTLNIIIFIIEDVIIKILVNKIFQNGNCFLCLLKWKIDSFLFFEFWGREPPGLVFVDGVNCGLRHRKRGRTGNSNTTKFFTQFSTYPFTHSKLSKSKASRLQACSFELYMMRLVVCVELFHTQSVQKKFSKWLNAEGGACSVPRVVPAVAARARPTLARRRRCRTLTVAVGHHR